MQVPVVPHPFSPACDPTIQLSHGTNRTPHLPSCFLVHLAVVAGAGTWKQLAGAWDQRCQWSHGMCVCLALWGEGVCIIPWNPGSCFPHLFSSGFFRGAGIGHGGGGILPSYTCFRRCRSRGTDTCASVLQQVWAGVHLISLHPPWIPAQGPWRSWDALPGKSCCSYPARQLQAHRSVELVWLSLCLTLLQPDLGPAVTCSFGPIGFYFLFFLSGNNCPHLNGVTYQSHLQLSGMDHPRGEDVPCPKSARMGMWAGSKVHVDS